MLRDTNPKVLVVEDQADYQVLISRCLQKEGFDVACVGQGEEVIERARKEHPDLILLDLGDLPPSMCPHPELGCGC